MMAAGQTTRGSQRRVGSLWSAVPITHDVVSRHDFKQLARPGLRRRVRDVLY